MLHPFPPRVSVSSSTAWATTADWSMHRQQPGGRGSATFDGPGARSIVDDPGPLRTNMQGDSPQSRRGDNPHHQQQQQQQQQQQHYYNTPSSSGSYSHPQSSSNQHHQSHAHSGGASHHTPSGPILHESPSSIPPPASAGSTPVIKRVGGKANVSSACGPCKRAHLACDVARPCKRCVNMGKEDQCEDVPVSFIALQIHHCKPMLTFSQHKKRGRPRVNKTPTSEPYPHRPRPAPPPHEDSKWKGPASYDSPYAVSASTTSPPPIPMSSMAPRLPSPPRSALGPPPLGGVPSGPYDGHAGASSYNSTSAPPSAIASGPSGPPPHSSMPEPFVLFCSTELKILRVTSSCHHLIGYHPHEFANLNLLDWLHPADRHLIETERNRLVSIPYLQGVLQSNRDTHAAVMAASERELLSPAVGMREPYPNQNVRILRSDNGFSLFNVRLHLGGGLNGSLWQPETLGKIYLVVSCLLISDRDVPPEVSARRPPPSTPSAPPPALPSFSSIAAAADRPDPQAQPPQQLPSSQGYPYASRSGSAPNPQHQQHQPPQQGYYGRPPTANYPPPPPGSSTRRTPSPNHPQYPSRPSHPSSASYPPPPGYYPPSGQHVHYPREHHDEWRRQGPPPPSGPPGPPEHEYRYH